MARAFSEIAFTPGVREFQARMGSRHAYAALDHSEDRGDALGDAEAAFIAGRDGFYQASVGENGWPYVQFRGGPAGFLRVLDARTIAYADFRGNRQYISTGNLAADARVMLFLMDYAGRQRLKLWGRARLVAEADDPALIARLENPAYRARIERAVVIEIAAFDWNCPQHITPRFTAAEFAPAQAVPAAPADDEVLGDGPLELVIAGVRQLTPRVRAYELRSPDAAGLPAIAAGAHIDVPLRLGDGRGETRRYSISSNPARRDAYEIAVLREDAGSGGSAAIHASYRVGLRLRCGLPGNDFPLSDEPRPVLLIAGGIGITPIKAMALQLAAAQREFRLHYSGRSAAEMAYRDRLERQFGALLTTYVGERGERLDVAALIAAAPADAVFYVCGPSRLIDALRDAAAAHGVAAERLRFERFHAPTPSGDRALSVELRASGRRIEVAADQSILDAVHAAGVDAPAGCRAGVCGTCAVRVLAGIPEHRDDALSPEQRADQMCICVSRAQSDRLVLDL